MCDFTRKTIHSSNSRDEEKLKGLGNCLRKELWSKGGGFSKIIFE